MTDIAQQNRTFYTIADDLSAYFESLDMAEAQLAIAKEPEERKELEAGRAAMLAQIERLGGELALKAEAVAGVIRRLKSEAELLSAEEMALTRRRMVIERSEAWLKQYVIAAMKNAGVTQVKATKATLRIQGNGGVQPLVVDDDRLIPEPMRLVTMKLYADQYERLWPYMAEVNAVPHVKQVEPSQARIREALTQPCPTCNGGNLATALNPCSACHGTGKATVPGAHLAERGEHLRIT